MAEAEARLNDDGTKSYEGDALIGDMLERLSDTQKEFLDHYGFHFVEVAPLLEASFLSVAVKAAIISGKTKAEFIATVIDSYEICYKEAEADGILKALEEMRNPSQDEGDPDANRSL